AAPDLRFVEIDALAFAGDVAVRERLEEAIAAALAGADALIAHAGAARPAIEAIARTRPDLPVLLLSPILVETDSLRLRTIRAIAGWRPLVRILTDAARAKRSRLMDSRAAVIKQLRFFVGSSALSDALIAEAQERLDAPGMADTAEQTSALIRYALAPIDPAALAAVRNRKVLVGVGPMDRKTAKRTNADVLPAVWGAPMLEAPDTVVQALRAMLGPAISDGSGAR
ncbi:MAG TPA: hypothetical protein VGC96_06845, partial [Candidatus Elarobacter sp.]